MARITVEDCVKVIHNRFELVAIASKRSRELSSGVSPTVEKKNDKNPVIALREIAKEHVNLEEINNSLINSYRKSFIDQNLESIYEEESVFDEMFDVSDWSRDEKKKKDTSLDIVDDENCDDLEDEENTD